MTLVCMAIFGPYTILYLTAFALENNFPNLFSSYNFQDFSFLNDPNSPIFHPLSL